MSNLYSAQHSTITDSRNGGSPIVAIILVVVALVSATILSAHFSSIETYAHEYEVLESKRDNAVALTCTSAAVSAVLTVAPDDTLTPVASQLAEVSRDLSIVLGAIMVQEWLLTALSFLFFGLIVPICCLALAIAALLPWTSRAKIAIIAGAVRVLFAVAILWASVPCSVFLTDKIDETHAASIQSAIDAAEQMEVLSAQDNDAEPKSLWASTRDFFNGVFHPTESLNTAVDKASELVDYAKSALGMLVEEIAVMVVTTCVIPILTPALALCLARLALKPALSLLQHEPRSNRA